MQHPTNKTWRCRVAPVLGPVITLALGACAPHPARTVPRHAVRPSPMTHVYPTVDDAVITPTTSRPLGVFATEADAVAAARAAALGPGIYGLAMAGDRSVAITADGTVYLRVRSMNKPMTAPMREPLPAPAEATSGAAQRPPQ